MQSGTLILPMKTRRTRADFRFLERLRVRWAEIDAQQIVFNGHYLMYVDTAVAGYWRALGVPYGAEAIADLGGDMVVRKATLEYAGSARYDDVLDVGIRAGRIGTTSIVFEATVFKGETPLVEGELVYVFVAPGVHRPLPVTPACRDLFGAFEAGAEMIDVRVGDWRELGAAARPLRRQVFVDEQGLPAAMEANDADDAALHAVATNRLGRPLATGRLVAEGDGVATIGRMAVRANARNSGLGRRVLDALVAAARARGAREVALNAEAAAERFYARAGFERLGDAFEVDGIAHVAMRRAL